MMLRNRFLPHPLLSFFLWVIWLLLNNTLAPGHMVLGALLALLIPYMTTAFWPEQVCVRKPVILVQYLLRVIKDILIANLLVARWVLSPNNRLHPAFIEFELAITSPIGISILASTISLTPGTVSCDVSADQKYLLIHSLHVDDVGAILQDIRTRYEQPLMEVLRPC